MPLKPSKSGCRIDIPKSGKPRAVVIPPHIRSDVKHHLDVFTEKGARGASILTPLAADITNDKVFRTRSRSR